tara:strand:- start:2268 stop:2678 length:411 start_codon:yes stop_codon:yes gene_type:complete
MKILFICRHNRFRSKVAEAYFKKINKNRNLKSESAGIFIGSYPFDKDELKIEKKLGIKIKGKPRGISTKLLRWQDLIVAITDDLPKGLFNYESYKNKVVVWKFPDNISGKKRDIEKTIKGIMKKVENFVKKLEKKK